MKLTHADRDTQSNKKFEDQDDLMKKFEDLNNRFTNLETEMTQRYKKFNNRQWTLLKEKTKARK